MEGVIFISFVFITITSLTLSKPVASSLAVNTLQLKTIKSASHRSFQIIFFSDLAAGEEGERVLHHVLRLTAGWATAEAAG